MVGIWEMGIFLAGIGLLILCIFTAVTIRDFGVLAKKLDKVIDENEDEIKMISKSAAGIAGNLDSISTRVEKVVSILTAFEQLKSVLTRKKNVNKDNLEDIENIVEDVVEEYFEANEKSSDEDTDDNCKTE